MSKFVKINIFWYIKLNMDTLPFEIFYSIATRLTPSEFVRLCSTSRSNLSLCHNEDLWKQLSQKEFPGVSKMPDVTWRSHYLGEKRYYEKHLKEF